MLKRIIDGFWQIIQDKAYQNIFIILQIKDLKTENIIYSLRIASDAVCF